MLDRLGQAYRLSATGLAVLVFNLGGSMLALLVFPLIGVIERRQDRLEQRIQGVIQLTFQAFVWCIVRLGIIRLEFEGKERLRHCGGCVVVANHPTLIDVVLLLSLVPRGTCIVKHQLWENVFLRGVVSRAGYIRNDLPADQLIERCAGNFAAQGNLLIFPEGTRTEAGADVRFQRGFANIALLARADLQLVAIQCEPLILSKSLPWYIVPLKRPQFRVSVLDRLPVDEFATTPHRSLNARKLVRTVEALYRTQFTNA